MKSVIIGLVLAASGTAHAFHTPSVFEDPVADGGGNRVYFTGSARQAQRIAHRLRVMGVIRVARRRSRRGRQWPRRGASTVRRHAGRR